MYRIVQQGAATTHLPCSFLSVLILFLTAWSLVSETSPILRPEFAPHSLSRSAALVPILKKPVKRNSTHFSATMQRLTYTTMIQLSLLMRYMFSLWQRHGLFMVHAASAPQLRQQSVITFLVANIASSALLNLFVGQKLSQSLNLIIIRLTIKSWNTYIEPKMSSRSSTNGTARSLFPIPGSSDRSGLRIRYQLIIKIDKLQLILYVLCCRLSGVF